MQICCPLTGCVTLLSMHYWVPGMCGNLVWDQHSLSLMLRFWSHGGHNGVDDLTSLFHIREGERESTTVAIDAGESTENSSGNFEEMPSFSTPRWVFQSQKRLPFPFIYPCPLCTSWLLYIVLLYIVTAMFVWSVWLMYIRVCKDDSITRFIGELKAEMCCMISGFRFQNG